MATHALSAVGGALKARQTLCQRYLTKEEDIGEPRMEMEMENPPNESPMSLSRIARPARLLGLSPVKAPTMQSEGNPYLVSFNEH